MDTSSLRLLVLVVVTGAVSGGVAGHLTSKTPAPKTFGASPSTKQPIINPNWSVPAWALDTANVSGCASDTNNCTQTTCGGGSTAQGPCATIEEIVYDRWGCYGDPTNCPRLFQATTLTEMSADSNNQHPQKFHPACERGGFLKIEGVLPTPTHGTTSNTGYSIQNRTTGTITTQTFNTPNPGWVVTDIGLLFVDTTSGLRAWTAQFINSGHERLTSPLVPVSLPTSATNLAEVTSFSSTGTWAQYAPVAINITELEPRNVDSSSSQPCIFLHQLKIYDPNGAGVDAVKWGNDVASYETSTDRVIQLTGSAADSVDDGFINGWNNGGLIGNRAGGGHFWRMNGGGFSTTVTQINSTGAGVALDADVIFSANANFTQGVSIGLVNVQTGITLAVGGGPSYVAELANGYSALSLWGLGTIDVRGSAKLGVDLSVNTTWAATTQISNMLINGSTTACSVGTGAGAAWNCGITVNNTNLAAAVSSTGFGNVASIPGGASISNNLK